jgi:YD repeat-containing protein
MDTERISQSLHLNWPRLISFLVPIALLLSMLPVQSHAVAQYSYQPPLARPEAVVPATQPAPNPATLPTAPSPIPPPTADDIAHNCAPSASGWTRFAGSGVNVVCGNFVAQSINLSVPGRGLPFAFVRTYNSANVVDGPLGFGWTHNYSMSLTVKNATQVLIRTADGRLDEYILNSGSYIPPPGSFSTLTDNGDGTFTLKDPDQTRYRFDANGRLTSIADRNDNTLTLGYTVGGLTNITDTVGRVFSLTYDANGRLTQLADSMTPPRTVGFAYNAAGDLVSTTDTRGKTTVFTYDGSHRLLTVTDARPQIVRDPC